jgi:hypothetical protein
MADVNHRNIQLPMQGFNVGQNFLSAVHVKGRQRLIHQQQAGADRERAGDRHALPFTA